MPARISKPGNKPSPALARVARGDLCAGCGACAGLVPAKLHMELAQPGFLRPVQTADLTPAEDALIAHICPGLGQNVVAAGRASPVLWGPYISVEAGWACDPAVRFAGSSGGALSMLLIYLITSGVVDAVVQTAADPANPIGNRTVISTDAAGILAAAGSRYAPSAPLSGVGKGLAGLVADGRRFAFLGKPCDAAALRALTTSEPAIARAFPVILSFFCAGVPSQTGGLAVLAALGTAIGTAPDATQSFRFRGNGWPGEATALLNDGSKRSMSYRDSWANILSRHVQLRCKICADGTGVAADIVCADAWETDAEGYPLFTEADGVSLIMGRTALGADLIAAAKAAGQIGTAPFDMERLTAIQPGQRDRRRGLLARLLALRLLGRPVPRYQGLQITRAALQNPLRRNLRNFFGTLRRALRQI